MKKIEYYQLIKTEWVADEIEPEPKAQTQEIGTIKKKEPTVSPQWVSSLLIGLIIVEVMVAVWLYLN